MYAAENGHARIVQALLTVGANPNFVSTNGTSAFGLAAQHHQNSVLKELLPVNDREIIARDGIGLLEEAVQDDLIDWAQELIDHGVDPNKCDALNIAVRNNRNEITRLLLPISSSALIDNAFRYCNVTVFEEFLNRASHDAIVLCGTPKLLEAVTTNDLAIIESLIKAGVDLSADFDLEALGSQVFSEETGEAVRKNLLEQAKASCPILAAISNDRVRIFKLLLACGVQVNPVAEFFITHTSDGLAIRLELLKQYSTADKNKYGSFLLVDAIRGNSIKTVTAVLALGINSRDVLGEALNEAIDMENSEILKILLLAGADPYFHEGRHDGSSVSDHLKSHHRNAILNPINEIRQKVMVEYKQNSQLTDYSFFGIKNRKGKEEEKEEEKTEELKS